MRLLALHGHFYQPPRENPWIEEIEVQDSAAPFHDWNERITAECYGPNGAARIKNGADRIVDIANTYLHLSFNFGPTLLAWLERHRPEAYARVLEADAASAAQRGHGNALAQAYAHSILPLCSPRDRRTEIRWGLVDFRKRFRREPEGIWLPETAADSATLADVAAEGIRFTVLSPYQALRVRAPGGPWIDAVGARFDPTRPYRVRAGSRELTVFFYDGHIARDLAFGDAFAAPGTLDARLDAGYDPGRGHDEVLTVAFDGETLGHHRKGADEVLAETLRRIRERRDVEIVNLGQALDRIPAAWEAEIVEGSSWSCAHGVERWRSDCGCHVGGQPGWRQAWRAPLRGALDGLRDQLASVYEREASPVLRDPWGARDRYVELVLDPERREAGRFLAAEAGRPLEPAERVRVLRLLEMQRQAQLMYTSCGWFFAEISGLETVQVMKYAARAIQLARDASGVDLEPSFEAALVSAPSNVPELRDGRQVYEKLVRPSVASLEHVCAHIAISSTVTEVPDRGRLFCYRYRLRHRRRTTTGPALLTMASIRLESLLTQETLDAVFCVIHFGASDFRCGVVPFVSADRQVAVERALFTHPERTSLSQVMREVDRFFPGRDYTLRDLFLDERRSVANALLADTMHRYEADYLRIFQDNRRLMEFLSEIDSPIPGPLRIAADVTLTGRLLAVTGAAVRGDMDLERAEVELSTTVKLARRLDAHLHLEPIRRDVELLVRKRIDALLHGTHPSTRADELCGILGLSHRLGLWIDLWSAQNRFWEWTASGGDTLDPPTLARLARQLWFDDARVLERARPAPEDAPGEPQEA